MTSSLRAILDGLFDYAGLFPPAALALEPALRNYAAYRAGEDAWMLGRFILPAAQLDALGAHAELLADGDPPFAFSLLAGAAETATGLTTRLLDDLSAARAAEARHAGRLVADGWEVKLPEGVARDRAAVADLLDAFVEAAQPTYRLALEIPLGVPGWTRGLDTTLDALARHTGPTRPGLKLRCGGVTADAFPSVETLATAVAVAREAGVPFKATAGLHHPIRHLNAGVGTRMHGFVNLFGAAALARTHRLSVDEIAPILAEEDADAFAFRDDGFAWRELTISTADLETARTDAALSYGTCSFDEPREDLAALGWLNDGDG